MIRSNGFLVSLLSSYISIWSAMRSFLILMSSENIIMVMHEIDCTAYPKLGGSDAGPASVLFSPKKVFGVLSASPFHSYIVLRMCTFIVEPFFV